MMMNETDREEQDEWQRLDEEEQVQRLWIILDAIEQSGCLSENEFDYLKTFIGFN